LLCIPLTNTSHTHAYAHTHTHTGRERRRLKAALVEIEANAASLFAATDPAAAAAAAAAGLSEVDAHAMLPDVTSSADEDEIANAETDLDERKKQLNAMQAQADAMLATSASLSVLGDTKHLGENLKKSRGLLSSMDMLTAGLSTSSSAPAISPMAKQSVIQRKVKAEKRSPSFVPAQLEPQATASGMCVCVCVCVIYSRPSFAIPHTVYTHTTHLCAHIPPLQPQ
jgi:hypothetical protein